MSTQNTILIVEDEKTLMTALSSRLSTEGFHVITADDGEEGLAKALQHHPDLILLDIILPKMDGITMLKKLRKDAWGAKASVILLTNLTDGLDGENLLNHQDDYLIKTEWTLENLTQKIKAKLALKGQV